MKHNLIDDSKNTSGRKYSILDRLILCYHSICLVSTLIYWFYYESVTQQVITPSHFKFRRFIYSNSIREIILATLILGILYGLFHAFKHKKYILLLLSVSVLILEIVLFNQLHISNGP